MMSHPYVALALMEDRHRELVAEADRHRRLAAAGTAHRSRKRARTRREPDSAGVAGDKLPAWRDRVALPPQ